MQKIGTEFGETNMWDDQVIVSGLMMKRRDKKTTARLSRLSRQTQYHVVLKPTIDEDELYTYLNTHTKYSGPSKFKAWVVFNWQLWHLEAGMSVQTIVLRGWTKDD
jgi:hypothetical protein